MTTDLILKYYDKQWGNQKLGKLWIGAHDFLENGKKPLLPAETFYSRWAGSDKDLALMTSKILRYLNFRNRPILRVNFSNSIQSPGLYQANYGNSKITINSTHRDDPVACAAILAHEICHYILGTRNISEENPYENEKVTDFASVFFGLGVLVTNGKKVIYKTDNVQLIGSILGFLALIFTGAGFISKPGGTREETSFGYWGANEYEKIFRDYIERNNINYENISRFIKS